MSHLLQHLYHHGSKNGDALTLRGTPYAAAEDQQRNHENITTVHVADQKQVIYGTLYSKLHRLIHEPNAINKCNK